MRHGDRLVGVGGAHVEYDHSWRVVSHGVSDFIFERAVSPADERDPRAVRTRGEPAVGVARVSVLRRGGHRQHAPGLAFERVLPVTPALRLLSPHLGRVRIHVCDVDERRVPFLLLGHREVQTQQMHEAEGQEPGGQRQTTTRLDHRQCHSSIIVIVVIVSVAAASRAFTP